MIQFCLSVLCVTSSQSSKKAKFSSDSLIPRDPRLRAKSSGILSTSPELPHKVHAGVELRHGPLGGDLYIGLAGEELRHGPAVEGDVQHGLVVEDLRPGTLGRELRDGSVELQQIVLLGCVEDGDKGITDGGGAECGENQDVTGVRVKTNMFEVKYLMWFELGIEGKDPMDQEEDDLGGKIEFGFDDKNFDKDIEDYFQLFEARVLNHVRDKVIEPPDYDLRNIVDLLDKYGDAHISDSGWREVDQEEWFEKS